MGMYTGIRVVGKLKPNFVDEIRRMMIIDKEQSYTDHRNNFWNISDHPVLREFGDTVGRASFIPYGALSYMPDSWEYEAEEAFYNNEIDSDGVWRFQSSLKNYEREIEQWMEEIVPVIFETCKIEYFYEEWTWSDLYELTNGKVVKTNDEYVKYGYDEPDTSKPATL